MISKDLVVITDGTITVYKSDGTLVGVASSEGGGNYRSAQLEEGTYYYIAEAPDRGTVVGDIILPDPMNVDAVIKNITVQMVAGVDIVPVTLEDKDGAPITTDVDVKIARIVGVHTVNGLWNVADVPVGTQLLQIIPRAGLETTYQNYSRNYNIADGIEISEVLYPPVNVQVRITTPAGVEIPGSRLYLGSTADASKEIYKTSGLFILPLQSDHTMTLTATAPNYMNANGVQRVVSYATSVTLGTPGNQSFTIILSAQISDGGTWGTASGS